VNILRLLKASDRESLKVTLYVTCLAGLANAVLIALINIVSADVASAKPIGLRLVLLYVIAAVTYFVANRASLRGANDLLQKRLGELKLRLADKIRHSELRVLERVGRGEIYATVGQETNHLSQNFPLLVGAGQSMFLVLFCLLYIATLSQISFVVISFFAVLGLLFFLTRRASLNREMVAVYANEAAMLESLTHFADGFQEIRLNADKNDALFGRFTRIVDDLETEVVGIGGKWVAMLLFSNAFMYGMLGVVIFVLPGFFAGYTDIIYKIAAAAIFCVGPVIGVAAVAHIYSRAEVGLGHVYRMEERLDEGALSRVPDGHPEVSRFQGFQAISFEAITFRYEDADGRVSFATGPWDIELRRGEQVFLRGGNGSGKSTALKLLCGLYRPGSGRIAVDGVPVDVDALQDYRELFSAVFSDFHLFDRLHGLEDVDPASVRELIGRMELTGKVGFADGRFSTLDLSTGQRKRLAMIVSLLEDRQIYLFDEWAADQDEHFRDVFYTQLLPDLKRRGKTIVAVTHDDRYWHLADRVITLDLGQMTSTQSPA
jgi:putative pyoverdin transport system ATP-binding/permease protein